MKYQSILSLILILFPFYITSMEQPKEANADLDLSIEELVENMGNPTVNELIYKLATDKTIIEKIILALERKENKSKSEANMLEYFKTMNNARIELTGHWYLFDNEKQEENSKIIHKFYERTAKFIYSNYCQPSDKQNKS